MSTEWLSIYWIAPVMGWLIAQLAKVVIAGARGEWRGSRPTFLTSGNMPSSHSGITFALLTVIAVQDGLNSAAFGIAFVVTSIVIYDALNVRRAVGEQGEVLQSIAKDKAFFTAVGHRPTEVIAGAMVGIGVGLALLQIL
ncbi:MAG TPA: divergent PAP2 family protein [Candidatus Saccharimonadales bacterium]|nr:divergent PAP2 family protein [Candidatus Saccharimonadales bacterium]